MVIKNVGMLAIFALHVLTELNNINCNLCHTNTPLNHPFQYNSGSTVKSMMQGNAG